MCTLLGLPANECRRDCEGANAILQEQICGKALNGKIYIHNCEYSSIVLLYTCYATYICLQDYIVELQVLLFGFLIAPALKFYTKSRPTVLTIKLWEVNIIVTDYPGLCE